MDQAEPIDIIIPIYNLIEYSISYSKSTGSLQQYQKDEPLNNNVDTADTKSESFKLKSCFTENAEVDGDNRKVKYTKIEVRLIY